MKKRVFRGKCPYESLFMVELDGDCRNCEYYYACRKRERRRKRRVRYRIRQLTVLAILAFIIIALFMCIRAIVVSITNDNNVETTITPSTAITDEPQGETTPSSSTDSSEIYVDVDVNVDVNVEISASENPDVSPTFPSDDTAESSATINEPTISAYEPGTVYVYELTKEDKIYIAKVVYAESRGEPYEGQVAVAAVILNRFFSDDSRFDRESIYTVVTQSGQFASIKGVTIEDLNSAESCMQAVEDACKGWDPTRVAFSEGAIFFYNPDGDLDEEARIAREGIETYQIGHHLFHVEIH